MHGSIDLGLKFVGFLAEASEFLVQALKLLGEILPVVIGRGGACVATGVEAPALGFDFGPASDLAQAGDVDVGAVRKVLLQGDVAAVDVLDVLARAGSRGGRGRSDGRCGGRR